MLIGCFVRRCVPWILTGMPVCLVMVHWGRASLLNSVSVNYSALSAEWIVPSLDCHRESSKDLAGNGKTSLLYMLTIKYT